MKERVTLTLNSELLKRIDSLVNGRETKNRSHAVELFLTKALGANAPKKAVILAGGLGTALKPLSYETNKALIPIHGKTITEHLLDLFKKCSIREVFLAVDRNGEKIKAYFGDGSKFGVSISYIEEKEPLGTAGPLRMIRDLLDETFIVSNCDLLININVEDMFKLHKDSRALATIALTTVDDPSKFGVAKLDGMKILDFVEKPNKEDAPSRLVNSGFYILEPEIIDYIPKGRSMLEKDVFPQLARKGKIFGYPFSGQWFHTSDVDQYWKATKEWGDIK